MGLTKAEYETLLRLHYHGILGLAWRFLARHDAALDIAQDVFFKLWQHRETIDSQRAGGWLRLVARNLCLDRLRAQKRWRDAPSYLDEEGEETGPMDHLIDPAPLADEMVKGQQLQRRLGEALSRLPDRQRAAWLLAEQEGLTGLEIAKEMETTAEAVESLLARARRSLRQSFQSENPQRTQAKAQSFLHEGQNLLHEGLIK